MHMHVYAYAYVCTHAYDHQRSINHHRSTRCWSAQWPDHQNCLHQFSARNPFVLGNRACCHQKATVLTATQTSSGQWRSGRSSATMQVPARLPTLPRHFVPFFFGAAWACSRRAFRKSGQFMSLGAFNHVCDVGAGSWAQGSALVGNDDLYLCFFGGKQSFKHLFISLPVLVKYWFLCLGPLHCAQTVLAPPPSMGENNASGKHFMLVPVIKTTFSLLRQGGRIKK